MSKQMLGNYCPRCGKDVSHDLIRCSNCGTPISTVPARDPFVTAAAIFTIVAAGFSILEGVFSLIEYASLTAQSQPFRIFGAVPQDFAVAGILGVTGFAFGLASGVLSLARLYLPIALLGMAILVAAGVVPIFRINFSLVGPYAIFLAFGIPTAILGALALIFIFFKRGEFVKL